MQSFIRFQINFNKKNIQKVTRYMKKDMMDYGTTTRKILSNSWFRMFIYQKYQLHIKE